MMAPELRVWIDSLRRTSTLPITENSGRSARFIVRILPCAMTAMQWMRTPWTRRWRCRLSAVTRLRSFVRSWIFDRRAARRRKEQRNGTGTREALLTELADGVDPLTGECLPSDSVCNRPEIIRALHCVLQHTAGGRKRPSPPNAGKPWT